MTNLGCTGIRGPTRSCVLHCTPACHLVHPLPQASTPVRPSSQVPPSVPGAPGAWIAVQRKVYCSDSHELPLSTSIWFFGPTMVRSQARASRTFRGTRTADASLWQASRGTGACRQTRPSAYLCVDDSYSARASAYGWISAAVRVCLCLRLVVPCTTATCPLANSVDGLDAASYQISEADAGGVTNGSIELDNFHFRSPEVTERHLTANTWGVKVTVRCAAVAGHGCDGSERLDDGPICAQEGDMCNCTSLQFGASPYARFGRAASHLWSDWKLIDGPVACNAFNFGGDPAPGQAKECQCGPSTWGTGSKTSRCRGCAGSVVVNISGIGAYNASHLSTCGTCSCDGDGIPHRPFKNRLPSVWQEPTFDNNEEPQISYGTWNSTGDCTFDNVTGSGQCDCNQTNGTVLVPLGPWISSGNCSTPIIAGEDNFIGGTGQSCRCTNRGEVKTPPTTYNSSFDPVLSYISQWEVLVDTKLSYVTAYVSSVNSSLSYPRTYESVPNTSLSYATSWNVIHVAKTYNRTWTSGYNASLSYITGWTSVHNASLSYVMEWRTVHNSSKSHLIFLDSGANMTVACVASNCSCSDSGVSSTISPWNLDCGCECTPAITISCSSVNCSCSTTDSPNGLEAEAVTHSLFGRSCGCACVEASRATCNSNNCSCSTTETAEGVTAQAVTLSPIGKSCGCTCTVASQAVCSDQNCSCTQGVGGGISSTQTISWTTGRSYDCACGCAESRRETCSAGEAARISRVHETVGWRLGKKKSREIGCPPLAVRYRHSALHHDVDTSLNIDWMICISTANCSCSTTSTSTGVFATSVTHSSIGQSCGCRCIETSRAFCRRENCSCAYSIAAQTANAVNVNTMTNSPFNYDCGCKCSPATYSNCSAVNCSCSTNYCQNCSGSPLTHSPIDKSCSCACRRAKTSYCSSANCTCAADGSPQTFSPIGQSCGCQVSISMNALHRLKSFSSHAMG